MGRELKLEVEIGGGLGGGVESEEFDAGGIEELTGEGIRAGGVTFYFEAEERRVGCDGDVGDRFAARDGKQDGGGRGKNFGDLGAGDLEVLVAGEASEREGSESGDEGGDAEPVAPAGVGGENGAGVGSGFPFFAQDLFEVFKYGEALPHLISAEGAIEQVFFELCSLVGR